MKRIAFITSIMLSFGLLLSCSNDTEDEGRKDLNTDDIAFVSFNVKALTATRSSGEDAGVKENDLKTLYLITFDNSGKIVGVPGTSNYFTKLTNPTLTPDPIKIGASGTNLLVIANPGTELGKAITALNSLSTYAAFNTLISGIQHGEVTDDLANITKGFAMISTPDDTGMTPGQKIDKPLVDISGKIQVVSDSMTEAEAIEAAKDPVNKATIKIERLASKIVFKLAGTIDTKGATFEFGNWTLDAVNSQLFPFAEKTIISVPHTPGSYKSNFYTKDPNYEGMTVGAGLGFTTVNADYEPAIVSPYDWMDKDTMLYCIENTMAAAEQQFGNATRVVVKGTYTPAGANFTPGEDWFSFAGLNYYDLKNLQDAYDVATSGGPLKTACDKMYLKIKTYADAKGLTINDDFASLSEQDLEQIPNGGELIKDGKNDVIRWYQNGLNYYYNEIRHNNEADGYLAYSKYGVVRNNWYSLTLSWVYGPGTPWYPDLNNPGPGDPEKPNPIDPSTAYLGIVVEVEPWILWENNIGF